MRHECVYIVTHQFACISIQYLFFLASWMARWIAIDGCHLFRECWFNHDLADRCDPIQLRQKCCEEKRPQTKHVFRELFVRKMVAVPMPNCYHLSPYLSPKKNNFWGVVAHLNFFFRSKKVRPCFFTNETLSIFFGTQKTLSVEPQKLPAKKTGDCPIWQVAASRLPSSTPPLTNSGWVEHLQLRVP